jgi:integrase/recombinase XerD
MTPLAPHLTTFLRERLPRERHASPHTCDAYAYAFQLLLTFASKRLRTQPSALSLEQLDVPLVLAFLDDLGENGCCRSGRSRRRRFARGSRSAATRTVPSSFSTRAVDHSREMASSTSWPST